MAQVVLGNINQDTFGDFLDVASSHRLERLEAKCIDYLLANFNKVAQLFDSVYSRLCLEADCFLMSFNDWHDAGLGMRSGKFYQAKSRMCASQLAGFSSSHSAFRREQSRDAMDPACKC